MPTLLPRNVTIWLFTFMCGTLLFLLLSCSKMESPLPDASIISFKLSGISSELSSISDKEKRVEIIIAYGKSLKSLTPIIEISQGATIVPASNTPQDFSQPVYYVLTSAEGKKTIYKVSVSTLSQPIPEVKGVDKNEFEAGETILIKGRYFGNNPSVIKTYLVSPKNEEILITSKLIDTNQIQISVPQTLSPQAYRIKVNVKDNYAISDFSINVQYPSPTISSLSKKNILQGDTLFLKGSFIVDDYRYQLLFNDGKKTSNTSIERGSKGFFGIIPKTTAPGIYSVNILNETLKKQSNTQAFSINLYDFTKPFVEQILNPKTSYLAGDKVVFKAINFESFPARFYQIQLNSGSTGLIQNGLYVKSTSTLNFDLPSNLSAGIYNITITLINLANQTYTIELDTPLVVK